MNYIFKNKTYFFFIISLTSVTLYNFFFHLVLFKQFHVFVYFYLIKNLF